jgi:Family of unknown function (DUF5771)
MSCAAQEGGYMPNDVPFIENAAPFGGWRKKISRNGYSRGAHTRRAYSSKGHNIVRKATVRKSRVPTSLIKDQGARGKWREVNKSHGIEINHPGSLSSMGYSVVNKPASRHSSLRRVIKKFGPTSTYRKLKAVATFTKRTSKGRSIKFNADSNWVKKKYM